jgi:predicted PurR-regulated permease PerM
MIFNGIHVKKYLLFLFVLALGVFIIININDMFFGIIMALLLDHIVELLEDYGFNKYVAIGLTIIFIILGVFSVLFNLLPIVYGNVLTIIENFEQLLANNDGDSFKINFFITFNASSLVKNVIVYLKSLQWDNGSNTVNWFDILKTGKLVSNKLGSLFNIVIGFSGTIFIARSLFNSFLSTFSQYQDLIIEIRTKIKNFLFFQLIIALFNGLFFIAIINFFALKGAFSIGLIVAIASFFIISFGALVGIAFSLIMLGVQQYNLLSSLIIFLLLSVVYLVESYILIPQLICNPLEINYLTLLIGILSISKILGLKYLLFTVPLIIIIKKVFKMVVKIK